MNKTTNRQKQDRSQSFGFFIAAMCLFTFVFGLFFSVQAYAQAPQANAPSAATSTPYKNGEPSLEMIEVAPFANAQAQHKTEYLLLRSIELVHATLFAILVINAAALLVFAVVKLWPRRSQVSSKKLLVNDRLQIDRQTAIYIVQANDHEHLILIGPNQQSVIDLAPAPKSSKDQTPFTPMTSQNAGMTRPLDDDEAVTAAVRSMLKSSV